MSGPFHTVYYLTGYGTTPQTVLLPSKGPLDTRTYTVDVSQFCADAKTTVSSIALSRDPSLNVGSVVFAPGSTSVQFVVQGGDPATPRPTLPLRLILANGDWENILLVQPITPLDPAIPTDVLVVAGEVITAGPAPVDITLMPPIPGGPVGSDLLLLVRPGSPAIVGGVLVSTLAGLGVNIGGDAFTFHQPTPSTIWNITHNLGKHPTVNVVDSAGDLVEGDILYVDGNNIIASFAAGFSGSAYLN